MNYYNEIKELNDKVGRYSFITIILAVVTLTLTVIESGLFIVTFVAFLIIFIFSTITKKKLRKLQQSIFDEYARQIVNAFGFDAASNIRLDKFFTARAEGNRLKLMAIYDANLELNNDEYMKLLIAIEKNGMDEYTNKEFLAKDFDIASYVKTKKK